MTARENVTAANERWPLRPAYEKPPKLTPKQRDEIRTRYAEGETAPDLAREFGVTTATIHAYSDRRSGRG